MPAYVGKAPWYQGVSETYKNGRRKTRLVSGDQEWSFNEGWHAKRKAGWYNRPGKSKIVTKRKVTAPDGSQVEIYRSQGYDDYIGFHNNGTDEEAAAYAYNALDAKNPSHGPINTATVADGHIKKIEYASREQVMRVTFANGGVCLFFRIPTAIGGVLLHIAESNRVHHYEKNGTPRHLLGVMFWNYVRIRHQRYGARYPFQYEKHGALKLTKSNKRYTIRLTKENFNAILGEDYKGPLKPGMTISSVMSEDEYKAYDKAKKDWHDNNNSTSVGWKQEEEYNGKTADDMSDKTLDLVESSKVHAEKYVDPLESIGSYKYNPEEQFFAKEQKETRQSIDRYVNGNGILNGAEFAEWAGLHEELTKGWKTAKSNRTEDLQGQRDAYLKWADENPEEYAYYAERVKAGDLKQAQLDRIMKNAAGSPARLTPRGYVDKNGEERYDTVENILGPEKAARWRELNMRLAKPTLANKINQRVWSKTDLIAMGNLHLDGSVTPAQKSQYDMYIRSEDWNGALEWLKHNKGKVYGYDHGHKVLLGYSRPYAGPSDQFKGD